MKNDAAGFTEEELRVLLDNLDSLSDEEAAEAYRLVEELDRRKHIEQCQDDLIAFCKHMQKDYLVGKHHRRLSDLLTDVDNGARDRICVNIPPRFGKSQLISTYFPAWFLGRHPDKKVMLVSHTTDLAVDFGRKVRNILLSEEYQEIFPNTKLAKDSKSAGRWNTSVGGEFYAAGVGSALAGRGADLLLVDDPHALEVSTLIPTPNGFVEIQDLAVGDYVFGPDGEPTKVVAKSDVYHDRELYSVITSDGEEILCDAKHLWGVNSDTNLAKAKVANYTAEYLESWPKANRPVLPRHQPVNYPHKDLPIDPWVLGAWLGDGTASSGRMTADPKTGDQEYMISEFRKAGYEVSDITNDGWTFTVYGLMPQLRALGVLNNKHIPEMYLTASIEQRMSLLQGLVDTDGAVLISGQAGFYNCNEQLVRGVVEILHSLGVRAQLRSYEDKRGRWGSAKTNHRVMFRLADCARMPRKLRYTRTPTDKRSRSIEVANTKQRGSVQCITVEREDGLFLAGRGYVVTHNSEQDVINGNFEVFEKAYEWFTYGARTRLMPGGRVAVVQCMTGDTPVRLHDGSEKPLADVMPGDQVATWDKGKLSTSTVVNHTSNGFDYVFTIQTTSHKVKANERHPFLVQRPNGEVEWIRLKNLKVGDLLVSLKGASAPVGRKQNGANASLVNQKTLGTENTQMHHTVRWGTTANTKAKRVQWRDARNLRGLKGSVCLIITRAGMMRATGVAHLKRIGMRILNTATVSALKSTMHSLLVKGACALYVKNPHLATTLVPIGTTNCASITATKGGKYEHSSATTVTLPSDTQKPSALRSPLLSTLDFTVSEIESILPSGRAEVFDVQIDRTENFIAGGLVSHNTRWHLSDLTGRLTGDMVKNAEADQYEVVEFPAILEVEQEDGGIVEKSLWPEFHSLESLKRTKASMPSFQWNAQYQQNPTSEEAAVIKREWWQLWEKEDPPSCEFIILSLDAAAEKHNRADFTGLTTWGVFFNEEVDAYHIILLNSIKKRLEFPELKSLCMREYTYWEPDAFIVEKKSAGVAIYQEFRRMGLPLQEFTPHRGSGDKMARLNSVADIFASGMVWVPQTRWAEEVVDEVAGFPFAPNDDLVDSTVMALMRFRQGGFIRLPSDEPEEEQYFRQRRGAYY